MSRQLTIARISAATAIALALIGCSSSERLTPISSVGDAATRARPYQTVAAALGLDGKSSGGYLYVSDPIAQTIQVFANGTYKLVRSIPDPQLMAGLFVDPAQNLYVSNWSNATVLEYAPGSKKPKCTYSSNIVYPLSIAVDPQGRVEIANGAPGNSQTEGWVGEFDQCRNKMLRQRFVPGSTFGIAIDAADDIFVSYLNGQGTGDFAEFVKGGATAKVLGATVGYPGGIALDSNKNLIVADQQQSGALDVAAPPYDKIKKLASVAGDPKFVAFNTDYSLLFSSNWAAGTVTVYSYPGGKLLRTLSLGGSEGSDGVADSSGGN